MTRAHVLAATDRSRSIPARAADATVRTVGAPDVCTAVPRTLYVDRAMLLWPRLDRARLLRVAGDPERIAVVVSRRTVQSVATILAMLERDPGVPSSPTESQSGFESGPAANARASLRFVKHDRDEGHGVPHKRPA